MSNPGLLELSELQFQNQVTQLAEMLGWDWVHFRAGYTRHGWRTPSQGTMAKGWPDLVMVRRRESALRLLVAELKRQGEKPSSDQHRVLDVFTTLAGGWRPVGLEHGMKLAIEVKVWQPSDWPEIETVLR